MKQTNGNGRKTRPRNKLKKWSIAIFCSVIALLFVVQPIATAIVYESIFSSRFETVDWMEFSASDFEDLTVERSDFQTKSGSTLAGFAYSKPEASESPESPEVSESPAKGVIVFAHGMGCGGHNFYLPFIDYFTSRGYLAFAYDATGNGQSGGKDVGGLPQGVIDLDYALRHVKTTAAYEGLPILLFGHSWGAYSAGNVLNFHDDVRAVALIAAFNESEDQLLYQSEAYVGSLAKVTLPYVAFYESVKFGAKYADATALDGLKNSDAAVLIAHSKNDETVPVSQGYDKFYKAFGSNDRFRFVCYEDKGHQLLLFSDEANAYREQINEEYDAYVAERGGKYSEALKREFMSARFDKKRCFQPNGELMDQILQTYDSRCT